MACKVLLDNATTLGWDVAYEYTANESEKLKRIKTVSVELLVVDLVNLTGVGECVAPLETLRTQRDWADIVIHSHDFGSGKLTSFDMPQGTFVNDGVANLSFQIEETMGDGAVCWLTGAGGDYYDGLPLTDPLLKPENLENLGESFSFSSGLGGDASFSHSIDVKFNNVSQIVSDGSSDYAQTNVAKAQVLAKKIFESVPQPPFGATVLTGILQRPNLKTYYSENLDYINADCSFEKSYSSPGGDCSEGACSEHSLSLSRDKCADTVSIDGSIKAIKETDDKSKIDYAREAYVVEQALIAPRITGFFNRFKESDSLPLHTDDAGELELYNSCNTIDEFEGTISYNADANNDPAQTGRCDVTRTQVVNYTLRESPPSPPKKIMAISENGDVKGKGKMREFKDGMETYPAYDKAVPCYNIAKSGVNERIISLYQGENPERFKEISSSEKKAPYQGSLSYGLQYNDDPEFLDDPCIKKSTISVTHTASKQRLQVSNVPNHPQLVEQKGYEKPKRSISINMQGGTGDCSGLATFLESGRSILIDRAATCYINGINYNYSENKDGKTFSLSCEMIDSGVKG